MSIAILAHGGFPDRAKTALGVLRYGSDEVAAVLDAETAGDRVSDYRSDVRDAPIVASLDDVSADLDALLIGVAPIGGGFDEDWRPDVRAALERGCDVIAGLHNFLAEDEEFSRLAAEHGCALRDVRRPPDDLTVAEGRAADVSADVVCTVGTDCSTGKMTAALELVAAARDRGIDAAFVPTGQTGIVIEGWGIPIDRTISDFTAGAVERMLLDRGDDHDLLVVEGQGAITHPAYSAVTCGILHGAMPDALVMCHEAGREAVHGYESFEIPPVSDLVALYENLAAPVHESSVVAGSLRTDGVARDEAARAAVDRYADAIDAPATDPIRFGAEPLIEALQ